MYLNCFQTPNEIDSEWNENAKVKDLMLKYITTIRITTKMQLRMDTQKSHNSITASQQQVQLNSRAATNSRITAAATPQNKKHTLRMLLWCIFAFFIQRHHQHYPVPQHENCSQTYSYINQVFRYEMRI